MLRRRGERLWRIDEQLHLLYWARSVKPRMMTGSDIGGGVGVDRDRGGIVASRSWCDMFPDECLV